ncbi:MAG: L-threonylcarbamoyladenylate synthase [Candidatus Nanohaloarchaea archaeon]|jgi:L-threonylcarbamoyladenylate synthase
MTDLDKAKKAIEKGGAVIFPTETAYGIAADATKRDAVEKVYEMKQRPRSKGLTAIVYSMEQAEKYSNLSEDEKRTVEDFMPGPLTLVAEKKDNIPDNLNSDFAFRISSSETARELTENTPITATSANISGKETSYSVEDISEELRQKADYIIDVGELEDGPTSTIAEVNNSELVIHRKGPVKRSEIEKVLQNDT